MTDIFYYKTNHPEIVAAYQDLQKRTIEFHQTAQTMRVHFGAKQVAYSKSFPELSVAGLMFSPPADTSRWTIPNRRGVAFQIPRQSKSMSKAKRITQESLVSDYIKLRPTPLSAEPVLKALGLSWGAFILWGGTFKTEAHDGWVYVKTSEKVSHEAVIEIIATEFNAVPEWEHTL